MTKPAEVSTREYVTSHALVTPSGKVNHSSSLCWLTLQRVLPRCLLMQDLQAMSDNMEKLKDEVLEKAKQLEGW